MRARWGSVEAMSTTGLGFSGEVAGYYARFRPGYPPPVVDALVRELGLTREHRLLDLGCGTGQLAAALTEDREVVGVDPAGAMLEVARRRPGGERVTWIEGDARALDLGRRFDLVLLTGHAFQVFLTPEDQLAVLRTIARHLTPRGRFLFDSRNPTAREWRKWTPAESRHTIDHPTLGPVEAWNEAEHDAATGIVKHAAFHAQVPAERAAQAKRAAEVLGEEIWRKFPFLPNMQPMQPDLADLVLNRTWKPFLAVTGADGLPPPASAGNVLRPRTDLVLSLRLPPTVKADSAAQQLKAILETDPPYGARVTYTSGHAGTGWHSPQNAHWLEKAINDSSRTHYGKPAMWMGEGGTIPFMAMLGVKYPQAQFLITGVLGPHSNAHGPNEFLHIDYAKRLTACVADVLAAHASKT